MTPLDDLAEATSAIAADVLDTLELRHQALAPYIRPIWPGAHLVGRVMPVVVSIDERRPDRPYDGEMRALDALAPGDVPVFEVPPESRAATWGELFSCGAMGKGAVGVVSDGDVRDARQIEELGFPTFARGCSPLDTLARAVVADFGVSAVCGGVRVARGDLIVADRDGVVVIPEAAAADVAEAVRTKRRLEDGARRDLLAGMAIHDVWERYRVF